MRADVEFQAGGVTLRGWLYPAEGPREQSPGIVMSHGITGTRDLYLDPFARRFQEAGMTVLLYDHRNTGTSDGLPRQEIDPWQQIRDMRDAITFLSLQDMVDPERIGLWGTSYSGGHALVVGANDRRVKCVVSQVPTISGHRAALRRVRADKVSELHAQLRLDRETRFRGGQPGVLTVISPDPSVVTAMHGEQTWSFFAGSEVFAPSWRNEITIRSIEFSREYEPGIYIDRVSPTPLLMVVALDDHVTPTDLCLEAYERALQPKKLVCIDGGHYAPYREQFEAASRAATDWFVDNLKPAASARRAPDCDTSEIRSPHRAHAE